MKTALAALQALEKEAIQAVQAAQTFTDLEFVENSFLGRKGKLTLELRSIKDLKTAEEKQAFGDACNKVRQAVENAVVEKHAVLEKQKLAALAQEEWLDVTSPGKRVENGHVHLMTQAVREIESIFARIGFTRVRHPEVDLDYYAFESLNMPSDHPARDEWETFFVGKNMVLTPHTSNGQVREMEEKKLPIRIISIGKTYRRQIDASHLPMFHQFEGLYVDKEVTVAHLKGVIDYFVTQFFGKDRKTRLRPFHFRFTEPSFEIDVSCGLCGGTAVHEGKKCPLCKQGWLELGGAGMTHPNVLRAGGIDPEKYSAFAFGFGVERTFMMKEGMSIPDIRLMYKNDFRFLQQL